MAFGGGEYHPDIPNTNVKYCSGHVCGSTSSVCAPWLMASQLNAIRNMIVHFVSLGGAMFLCITGLVKLPFPSSLHRFAAYHSPARMIVCRWTITLSFFFFFFFPLVTTQAQEVAISFRGTGEVGPEMDISGKPNAAAL